MRMDQRMKVPAFGHLQERLDGDGNEQQGWLTKSLRLGYYSTRLSKERRRLPCSHRRGSTLFYPNTVQ
jgi:hypothetical protein